MGSDARGRRHASAAGLTAGQQAARAGEMPRGRKLVVQMVETFREHMAPAFVDRLDAWELAERAGMPLPPVMIYGDDVSHVLTEEGIANLLLCILLLWAMFVIGKQDYSPTIGRVSGIAATAGLLSGDRHGTDCGGDGPPRREAGSARPCRPGARAYPAAVAAAGRIR
ncbi:hypothetical protein G6F32_015262 [Rhizopus arrhizus]|nr:hypothetical protein G6F32_015262 [Rhizopus arrhizus]